MDPLTLALTALNTGLEIFKLILTDIPVAERQKAWQDWFDFWRPILASAQKKS